MNARKHNVSEQLITIIGQPAYLAKAMQTPNIRMGPRDITERSTYLGLRQVSGGYIAVII
jgi:hypothetical protein